MKKKLLAVMGGICFVLGGSLAGADFDGIPWGNILGVALFSLIVPIAWEYEKLERRGK